MVTIWVETRTRVPERPGEYRVLQRGTGRKIKELTAYWNGRGWTVHGEILPDVTCWLEVDRNG